MKNSLSWQGFLCLLLSCFIGSFSAFAQPDDRVLYFDGVDDFVTVPSSQGDNHKSLTVHAWVKICDLTGSNAIVSKSFHGQGRYNYSFYIDGGKLVWQWYEDGLTTNPRNRFISDAVQLSTSGQWYHVGVTHNDTTDVIKIYVNGNEVAGSYETVGAYTSQFFPLGDELEQIRLGMVKPDFPTDPASQGGAFDGMMDDVVIFRTVRTPSEIGTAYSTGLPSSGNVGLLCNFKMEDSAMGDNDIIINSGNQGLANGRLENWESNYISITPFTTFASLDVCCPSSSSSLAPSFSAPDLEAEAQVISDLTVFPNPNTGSFRVTWPSALGETATGKIYHMVSGKLVFEGNLNRGEELRLSDLASGNYTITLLTSQGEILTGKYFADRK